MITFLLQSIGGDMGYLDSLDDRLPGWVYLLVFLCAGIYLGLWYLYYWWRYGEKDDE